MNLNKQRFQSQTADSLIKKNITHIFQNTNAQYDKINICHVEHCTCHLSFKDNVNTVAMNVGHPEQIHIMLLDLSRLAKFQYTVKSLLITSEAFCFV